MAADLTTCLAAYVGDVPIDDYLRSCVDEATALVGSQVGTAVIPQDVHDRAVMEVAAAIDAYTSIKSADGQAYLAAPITTTLTYSLGRFPQ